MSYRTLSILVRDSLALASGGLSNMARGAGALGGSRARPPENAPRVDPSAFWHGIPRSPGSAPEALACLERVSERLRAAGDPRAAFTDVYAIITRRVCAAVRGEAPPRFRAPRFMSRLAGRFCALYLAALRRSIAGAPEPISAWALAHRRTHSRRTPPMLHAVLGLNAHINYDLALGLSVNLSTLGTHDAAAMAQYRHDHDAVNDILEAAMPESLEVLSVRHGCPVSTHLLALPGAREAGCHAALLTLRVWRARVWEDMLALRAAAPADRRRLEARMNLRAALFGHLLSPPLPGAALARSALGPAPPAGEHARIERHRGTCREERVARLRWPLRGRRGPRDA